MQTYLVGASMDTFIQIPLQWVDVSPVSLTVGWDEDVSVCRCTNQLLFDTGALIRVLLECIKICLVFAMDTSRPRTLFGPGRRVSAQAGIHAIRYRHEGLQSE